VRNPGSGRPPGRAMKAIRVLVVDDHPIFRDGLRAALGGSDIEIVGEAATGTEATDMAAQLRPDVVLMDLQMPGGGGIDATRTITTANPDISVLVLTMSDDQDALIAAISAGARGYLLKGSSRKELTRAITAVRHGDAVFGAGIASQLLHTLNSTAPRGRPVLPELTNRERDVLALVAAGYTNTAIGRQLFVSPKTIRNHVSNILTKLQASNRHDAARIARDAGLTPPAGTI
jgi:DNA-binding NarL/FixJ family response regulator